MTGNRSWSRLSCLALSVAAFATAACGDDLAPNPLHTGAKLDVVFTIGDTGTDLGASDSATDGNNDAGPGDLGASDGALSDVADVAATGNFGAPCQTMGDCETGWCVQGPDGKVCSQACTDGCPAGWACKQTQGGGDPIFVCQPTTTHLCQPCTTGSQCNEGGAIDNLCVSLGSTGSYCGIACNPAMPASCPGTYQCMDVPGPNNLPAHQCLPPDGVCGCSGYATQLAAWTPCTHQNLIGTCKGQRHCGANGLTACDAPLPAAETCNSVDDDCNGQTDDGVTSAACEVKNPFGVCKGKTVGCQGAVPLCDAATPKPEVCNGLDDDCDGQTDNEVCEDGNPCSVGSCAGSTCKQEPAPNGVNCNDGNACTLSDECTAAACIGGDLLGCDDKNSCTQDACDPKTGCVHLPLDGTPCLDDGNSCTQDLCQTGQCAHPGVASGTGCETDSNPCTPDSCDGLGVCKPNSAAGLCTIDGLCVQAGTVDPSDPCKACNPLLSKTSYVPQDGLACDDDDPCTVQDKCKAGTCKGAAKDCSAQDAACLTGVCLIGQCVALPKLGLCDDGDPCTTADVCTGGSCVGSTKDCSSLSDACHTGICQGGACMAQLKTGGACDDGNGCTVNDTCTAAGCVGTAKDCSGVGGMCAVGVCQGGACVGQPINQGGACNDGNPCTVGDTCMAGACTGKAMDCSALNDACGTAVCSFGQCVKQVQGVCTPGQVGSESQGCGNCGTQTRTRTCTSGCAWGAWSAWGDCNSQGACAPGAVDSQSQGCGNCGSQTRTRSCSGSCQWGNFSAWGGCGGGGPCAPGATQACGDSSAPCEQQVCGGNCQWGGCGLKPGAACTWKSGTHYQCCGPSKWQFCSASCQWFSCQYSASSGCP